MNSAKYLIVGGGLSGHNAAKALRAADPQGNIVILSNEPHRPYDRPPLTKDYMQGKTPVEKTYYEPAQWYGQQNITLLVDRQVQRLDAQAKVVKLANGQEWSFEKALLATGGRPVKLDLPGIDLPGVHYFRTLSDAVAVSDKITPGLSVAIIGGGFIGLELASSLTQRGAKVSVIDGGPHIWSRFADPTLAGFFTRYCQDRGVTFYNAQRVSRIGGAAAPTSVVTTSGTIIPCDLVIVAAGIVPNVELAQQAGLTVDNGVVVNAQLQTSHPDIYAAGDLCNYPDPYFNRRRRVEHWGQADYTGTLAGQNMAGANEPYNLLSYVFSDIFDLHLEFAGDEHGFDRVIVRGRMEDKAFAVLYLKNSRLVAHFSVNLKRKQFSPLQKLIEKKVDLAGRETQLADMIFDVSTLTALVAAP
jgi:NADPH-dependent 2,4-dienoyl-CoA reductase/sulfur reductase-like enzyme